MKSLVPLTFVAVLLVSAQTNTPAPAGQWKPDSPVAVIDGKTVTAGELQAIIRAMPPQVQQQITKNSRQFLEQFGLLRRLSTMAEKQGLDKESPLKEQLEYNRMVGLAQAELTKASNEVTVSPEELRDFYEKNKERYEQARVKALYIPYVSDQVRKESNDSKLLSQAEAKAKAEKLLEEIHRGADFVKLVKEHSGDPSSAAKDGDFGIIRRSDKLPEPVKNTIFGLQPGQVSDVVWQPNGFYIFRLVEKSITPFEQVRAQIEDEARQAKFTEWVQATQKSVQVQVQNEAFFAAPFGAPAAAAATK